MSAVTDRVERFAEGDLAGTFRSTAKYGWIAKGLLYSGMGLLGLSLAFQNWSTDENASQRGALNVIADQPLGRVVVLVLAVGLALYAVWQLADSVVGLEDDTQDLLAIFQRMGLFGLSIFYGFLSLGAFELAIRGGSTGSGDGGMFSPSGLARTLMHYPLGRWAVAAAGLITLAVGLYHVWKSWGFRFLEDLDDDVGENMRRFGRFFGTYGMLARAAVLATAGYLVIEAAWTFDPEKAGGFDEALRELAVHPAGTPALAVVALGFVSAGIYDAVTYRHQTID